MATATPVGAGQEATETNEFEYVNEVATNEVTGKTYMKKVKRRRGKPPEKIIEEIQRKKSGPVEASSVKLDDDVDIFIKLRLKEWDKDDSMTFDHDEICAAMHELRDMQEKTRNLKWNIAYGLAFLLFIIGGMLAIVYIIMSAVKDTQVQKGGSEMTAEVKDVQGQKSVIETTQFKRTGGLSDLLAYDLNTSQWLMAEPQLRQVDLVSFKTKGDTGTFYNLDLAELIRIDSPTDDNDQVNMRTTGGHELRIWESVGELEVKWAGTNTWQIVDPPGRRLEGEADGVLEMDEPPDFGPADSRRLGKGLGSGGRTYVFVGSHHGHGGGSSGCAGWCSVPDGALDNCHMHGCRSRDCFNYGPQGATYRCYYGGASQQLTKLSQLFIYGLTALAVSLGFSN